MEGGSTDAIRLGERIRERLEQVRADFEPYEIREMFFQPDKVSDRLDDLAWSLVLSVLIIVAVVFAGMGIRMGLLVASILPMVALISVGLYDLGGGVLHQIAVIGMVISLGILIDNAIVIVENIQGHLDAGVRRLDALRKAVGELAGPLGASTGTTLAAFAPLLMADRKSTRLNSSYVRISYAVFCLKKKTKKSDVRAYAPLTHLPPAPLGQRFHDVLLHQPPAQLLRCVHYN